MLFSLESPPDLLLIVERLDAPHPLLSSLASSFACIGTLRSMPMPFSPLPSLPLPAPLLYLHLGFSKLFNTVHHSPQWAAGNALLYSFLAWHSFSTIFSLFRLNPLLLLPCGLLHIDSCPRIHTLAVDSHTPHTHARI